jgi:hypothetical protein
LLTRPSYDAAALVVDGGVTLDLGETVTGGPSRDPKTGRTIEWVRVFIPAGTRVFKFLRPNVAQQPTRLRSGILRTPPTVANFRLVPAAGPSPGTEFWTSRTNLVFDGDNNVSTTPPPPPPPEPYTPPPPPPRLGVAAALFIALGGGVLAYAFTRASVSSSSPTRL